MNQMLLEASEVSVQGTGVALIPCIILVSVGIIWLQVVLSKKQNKWLGLILPFLCLFISIMGALGTATFTTVSRTSMIQEEVNGQIVKQEVIDSQIQQQDVGGAIVTAVVVFVMMNIPTLILLAIYFACREKRKKNGELEKMNIQDLE